MGAVGVVAVSDKTRSRSGGPAEERAEGILQSLGFECDRVAEGSGKTPDFVAHHPGEGLGYAIEVKARFDDDADIARLLNEVDEHGVASYSEALGYSSTLAGVLARGSRQLRSYDATCRLLWIEVASSDLAKRQLEATLWGTEDIIDMDGDNAAWKCFFFSESIFFSKRRVLDGAVLLMPHGATLHINPHGPAVDDLRSSRLRSEFGSGVADLPALLEQGP